MKLITFLFIFLSVIGWGYAQESETPPNLSLNYQSPTEYIIADIKVEGAAHLSHATLISITGLKVGDKVSIPGDVFSNAIKKLWKQKLVGDVKFVVSQIQGDKIFLVIQIKERPRLASYTISGIRKSENTDIKEKIGFIRGQVLSDALKKNATFSIQKYFAEKGLFNTSVKITEQADSTLKNHVRLNFHVEKGKHVKINQIKINGNVLITEKDIKKQFKDTKQKNWLRVHKRSKYIKNDYTADKEALIAYYNTLGFRDADILRDSVYVVEGSDNRLINIDIELEEGKKYYFRNISWSGNYVYDEKMLKNVLSIQKGDIYNQQLLDSRLNFNQNGPDISSLYLDNGYLFFNINPIELRVEGDSIDLEMRIYEGNIATIGEVRIMGNTKTSDHVLLREIRTLPGDEFSRANLIRTQREISQLGYFDPEQIGIIPIPNPQTGTVDIEYRVVEKPSDQLQLSGGWGGFAGFVGTLGLVFNNFSLRNITKVKSWDPLPSGDGQRFSLSVQANGLRYQSYNMSFTEPWLGGRKPHSLTISLNHSISRLLNPYQSVSSQTTVGSLQVSGATISLGRRLKFPDDWFTLSNSLSYMRYQLDNYNTPGLCSDCDANNLSFNTTIARNDIGTNPQFPTQGSSISLSLSVTPPYSLLDKSIMEKTGDARLKWVEYHKWMFDFSNFVKLTGNNKKETDMFSQNKKQERPLVLNTRAHFGVIGMYNPNLGISPFERYALGGSGLSGFTTGNWLLGVDVIGLRGYDAFKPSPNTNGVIYNKFVTEVRFPIITQGVATIFMLGFVEAGNNWDDYKKYSPFDLKRSYGLGARIFMPAFGMIGIDYGIPLDNIPGQAKKNNSPGVFQFTIGQQLR